MANKLTSIDSPNADGKFPEVKNSAKLITLPGCVSGNVVATDVDIVGSTIALMFEKGHVPYSHLPHSNSDCHMKGLSEALGVGIPEAPANNKLAGVILEPVPELYCHEAATKHSIVDIDIRLLMSIVKPKSEEEVKATVLSDFEKWHMLCDTSEGM